MFLLIFTVVLWYPECDIFIAGRILAVQLHKHSNTSDHDFYTTTLRNTLNCTFSFRFSAARLNCEINLVSELHTPITTHEFFHYGILFNLQRRRTSGMSNRAIAKRSRPIPNAQPTRSVTPTQESKYFDYLSVCLSMRLSLCCTVVYLRLLECLVSLLHSLRPPANRY